MKKFSKNVATVLEILRDEIAGDVASALKKMTRDYTMTWVYKSSETLFPVSAPDFSADMKEVYVIRGRSYEIKNIAEGKNVVMVELIESYPDLKTKKIYRTPVVIVLELKNGKIRTGRHYCDPQISQLHLSAKQIDAAYPVTKTKLVLK